MKKQQQNGSAHLVIIIILTLGLVTALGWIFYQNFMHEDSVKEDTESVVVDKDEKREDAFVEKMKDGYLEKEKLAFEYPADWSLEISSDDATELALASDNGVLRNEKGEVVISIATGISGLGGACGDNVQSTFTVSGVSNTKTSDIFAAKAIYYNPALGYAPLVYLTKDKIIKTSKTCFPSYSVIYTGRSAGAVSFGNYPWSMKDGAKEPVYYKTKAEAEGKLDTGDLSTAYKVLLTAHYE